MRIRAIPACVWGTDIRQVWDREATTISRGEEVEIQWALSDAVPFGWWHAVIENIEHYNTEKDIWVRAESTLLDLRHTDDVTPDKKRRITLLFPQYDDPGWQHSSFIWPNFTRLEVTGVYGGIRALNSQEHAFWRAKQDNSNWD